MYSLKQLWPFFCVLFLLMSPASAHAEIPIVEPGDYGTFANPQWVAYPRNMSFVMGKLASADDIDVVAFDYVGGQPLNALVYVPAHEELRDFSPYIALVGPGLPAPTQTLPFAVPQGMGALVAHSTQTYRYFDVFTQMTFFPRAQINTTLPQTGRYYMAVWGQPIGRSLYALDIGIEETFAPQFLMRYPINWFHQTL